MKKILWSIALAIVMIVAVGCSSVNKNKDAFTNTEEVYMFEAVSSVNILNTFNSNSNQSSLNNHLNKYEYSLLGDSDILLEEEIDEINRYIGIMEQMLGDDEPITIIEETSDREEYENKLVITTKDIDLDEYTYVIYYNEEVLNDDDDDDDEEVESSLQGIMIVGDVEYTVYGKKEIEEDESKVEFTAKIDDNNWVKVEQKVEDDEKKFEYTILENGVESKTEIKVEIEDDETKISLEFENGNYEVEYEFKLEVEDGKKVIKIEVEDDNYDFEAKVYVTVDPETGEKTYEYKIKDSDKTFTRDNDYDDEDEDGVEDDLSYGYRA